MSLRPDARRTSRSITLLRGINVGRAKRIAMADLRALLEDLGATDVRTLLNSGNAVFDVPKPAVAKLGPAIEAEIHRRFGFPAAAVVHTAAELDTIVAENPLARAGRDPARLLVAFVASPAALRGARPLLAERWAPEALAIGSRAAYLWCAGGIAVSDLMQAFARATGDAATTRNWATVLKLHAAASGARDER